MHLPTPTPLHSLSLLLSLPPPLSLCHSFPHVYHTLTISAFHRLGMLSSCHTWAQLHTPTPANPTFCQGYLSDRQIELTFQTAFREGGTPDRPSVALYLSKHPNSHWVPVEGAIELSVSIHCRKTQVSEFQTCAASSKVAYG